MFNYVRKHARKSSLSQRVRVTEVGLPTSSCITPPVLDIALWVAAGPTCLRVVLLHLREAVRFHVVHVDTLLKLPRGSIHMFHSNLRCFKDSHDPEPA